MQALGAQLARQQDLGHRGLGDSLGRQLPGLFLLEEVLQARAAQPLPRDVWLPQIQVMAARDRGGTAAGLYVAAKGGHNAESHNHNDVGHFVVYRDGRPVIVDAGVEAYTAKTFSSRRYEIWTMQSAYHSLPTIGGVMQAAGAQYAARQVAYQATAGEARFELDLAGAFPPEAGLQRWQRRIVLRRGQEVEVGEEFTLERPVEQIRLSLLTPCPVEVAGEGVLRLLERELAPDRWTGSLRLSYPAGRLQASVEEMPLDDPGMARTWGGRLWRILLCAPGPAGQGSWTLRLAP
ncbi:MAG: heparinase II/III family protein [Candidatus Latescibacterota bacterium]